MCMQLYDSSGLLAALLFKLYIKYITSVSCTTYLCTSIYFNHKLQFNHVSENSALYSYEKCMIYFYVFVSELGRWRNEDCCCLRCLIHFWLEDVIKQVTKWFVDWFDYTDIHAFCDVMVVALPLTYVGDRVIEPMSNQTKHYQIGICNFSIKGAPLISRVSFIVFNATSKIFQLYRNTVRKYNLYFLLLC
jgi:hypothetical protein